MEVSPKGHSEERLDPMPADSASQGGLDPAPAPLSPPVEELARLESAEDPEQLVLGYVRDLGPAPGSEWL
jgi:hypothetical protein